MHTQITPNLGITPWTDLATKQLGPQGVVTRIGMLPGGMVTGKPSVALLIEHEDGTETVAEISFEHFQTATNILAIAVARLEEPAPDTTSAEAAEEAAIQRAREQP